MSVKKSRLIEDIGLILYKICLDIIYVFFICDEFGYYSFFKIDFDLMHFFEAWVLYIGLIALTSRKKSITTYYLLIQLVLTIVPMLVVYGLSNKSRYFTYLICIAHGLQCILGSWMDFKLKPVVMIKQGSLVNRFIMIVLMGITVYLTVRKFGIPDFRALKFSGSLIYEVRAQNMTSGILSYLIFWFFHVILPVGIIHGIVKRKKTQIAVLGVVALFLYLTYAHKSWLLSTFFIVAVYISLKFKIFTRVCCIGMPILVIGTMLCYKCSSRFIGLPSLFVRRLLILPASIKYEYYNFFSNKGKLFFSEGMIGKVFGMKSMYEKEIALLIGEEMGMPGASCNTGYMADAYANLGTVGVILFAFFLLVILKGLDSVLKKEDFMVNFSILSYSLFALNDGALLTLLLTGGLALLILMLVLERSNKQGSGVEL